MKFRLATTTISKALLACVVFLLLLDRADGSSLFIEISPEKLEFAGFSFEVKPSHLKDGQTTFLIRVTKGESTRFSTHAYFSLARVEISNQKSTISPIRKFLKKERDENSIGTEVTVDSDFLDDRSVAVVFANYAEMEINGKLTTMPGVDFFIIRLKDFSHLQK